MKLQYSVPLLSAAVVLVIGLATVPLLLFQLRRASVEQFVVMASGVSDVLEGYLESYAEIGDGQSVARAVNRLRGYPLLDEIVVYSSDGVGKASLSSPATGAATTDDRVWQVLRSGASVTQSSNQDGVNRLDVILPILNSVSCQRCHGTDSHLLGAVLVSLNTASQDVELRKQLVIVGGTGLLAFVLIEIALTLSLRQLILNPLTRLGEAAGRISQGDYSESVDVESENEMGVLAHTLNQMARRVAEHTAELREWGIRLESDVSRRTRELRGLNDVIAAASKSLDLDEILNSALDKTLETLEMDAGALGIAGTSGEADVVVSRGLPAVLAQEARNVGLALSATSPKNGQPARLTEQAGRRQELTGGVIVRDAPESIEQRGFQTQIHVPIQSNGDIFGDLCLLSRQSRVVSEQDRRLLVAIADAVAVGVRNAQISRRLREANREVSALIERAVAGGFDVRFDNPHLVRCWVENQCREVDCPAYGSANPRCWQMAGTLCPAGAKGERAMELASCRTCPVFLKGCRHDEITSIGESFNNLMFLLDYEAKQRAEIANQFIERLMAAQEEERKRVARELHDETSQSLTSLLVGLKALEGVRSQKEVRERARQLQSQALGTLDEVRRLAIELRPAALDELGLTAALRGYLKDTMARTGVTIEFQAERLEARLSSGLETALYRIVQESVTNAIRHGEARKIVVSLERRPSAIVARIQDDGKGFSPNSFGSHGVSRDGSAGDGLGLIGMRERATLFGGSLSVESRPGGGTTVSAEIPLAEDRVPEVQPA